MQLIRGSNQLPWLGSARFDAMWFGSAWCGVVWLGVAWGGAEQVALLAAGRWVSGMPR